MSSIAFATCARLADLDPDDRELVPELARAGATVRPAVWNDAAVDWESFDLIVLRSCWDYDSDVAAFRAWLDQLERLGPRAWNPAHVMRWNLDKTHLRELEESGIAIVPTTWIRRGSTDTLAGALDVLATEQGVVKPTVSFSAHGTWRAARGTPDEVRFRAQLDGGHDLMVQRFLPEITTEGEWSLVFLGGAFSHATLKLPAAGDFRVQEEFGGRRRAVDADPALVATCERVLAACPGPHLYARVDGVIVDGAFRLMEVELIDPSLYLADGNGAVTRFAEILHEAVVSRGC
ncbi:MAG: hypothetical protein GY711_29800 [bacterium]|nr:hypothetical protein [bacterium]